MSDAEPSDEDLTRFARSFAHLASEAHRLVQASSEVADLVAAHLGVDPSELPAIVDEVPTVERPNLQLALDVLMADNSQSQVVGLPPELRHYADFSLATILAGKFRGPAEAVPPTYDEISIDVDRTLRCVVSGLWLVWHQGVPVVIGAFPATNHGPPGDQKHRIEVFAAETEVAEQAVETVRQLRREHNVYRQKVLAFSFSEYGQFGISFMPRPSTTAAEVVLPPGDLASIERHTIGIEEHGAELRARGQHLKRGLLLYGPPGTGKTHTISYLMAAMPERTVLVLQGPGVGALGQAAAIARAFPPAMLVIEDVDLIASERGMMGMAGSNPLMFQLLNEMDGLAPADDVIFVLTTNRLDMLEPALAARPGRVDHAVHIDRPNADARRHLLQLYLGDEAALGADLDDIVARTEGVTASFFKELVRRAIFLAVSLGASDHDGAVEAAYLDQALTELLDHAEPIMRALLGAEPGREGPPGPMPPGHFG